MLEFKFISKWPTGSRYICNPAPTDTDNDTVVLVENIADVKLLLQDLGWDVGGSKPDIGEWLSFKKTINQTIENLIITQNPDLFNRWVTATELSKKLNLLNKPDRIAVFDVIVEGNRLF